ncbi:MFS general substrate transporter [Tothia fuscella]|uniref:MFS general substrate transporter n=1 Tax=Tothia fuscella TaxID=1048955 RepID=A0A9P4NR72_9PEZI|nr:MFS general substrate transporter [Tothia fuscella]
MEKSHYTSKFDHFHPVELSSEVPSSDVEVAWTEEEETAVRRKIDYHVVPVVTLLYLLCFIDRANIGNARVVGMGKDLRLVGYKFNWALTVFYIIYIFVEVPSNIVLKRIGARLWIPFLVFGFGAISIGTAFVKNFDSLMVVRAFLGLVEGGTMPGISFFLSTFYKREELLFRIGMFVSGSSMAGAFGGLLATGLSKIPQWGVGSATLHTWQNIFFFEGLLTMVVALFAPLFMPDRPETCKFLTDRERMIAAERLVREHKANPHENVKAKHVKMAIFNIQNTICALGFICVNVSVQSISLFMPTILKDMGYSPIQSQLHSVPPYITACAVSILIAWISDRTRRRGIYLAGFAMLAVVGFVILRNSNNLHAKYMAVFFVAIGAFPGGPGYLSWALNSKIFFPCPRRWSGEDANDYRFRWSGSTFCNECVCCIGRHVGCSSCDVGTIRSTLSPSIANHDRRWTYVDKDKPKYSTGHTINLSAQITCAGLAILGIFYCLYENKARSSGKRDHRTRGLTEAEIVDLGYKDPTFRYIS